MVERVDIEVVDKVGTSVQAKLKDIAEQSDKANKNLAALNATLSKLNPSALSRLAQANAQAATAALKNQQAAQQSAKAQLQQEQAAVKLQQAQSRLAQQQAQTATSNQRLQQSSTQAATAILKQQQATVSLAQAQLRLTQSQQRAQGGGSSAGAVVGATAIAAAGREILQAADSYQRFENRTRSVVNTSGELEAAMKKIVDVSAETHVSIEATSTLYQRLLPASQRLKVGTDDLWETILNLEKAFALSGATAGETQGAIIQLSQAVGGDFKSSAQELNTILEQSPILAKVLAQQLGTTSDQLKALAKDGQISSRDFFKAFSDGGKGIDELKQRFATLKPTISQAFQDLTTRATIFVGEIGKATGASDGLSQTIEFLSRHMEILAPLVTGVFAVLIPGLVTARAAQLLFNAAALKNPYIIGFAIFAGAIAAIAALYEKNETLRKSVNELASNTSTFIGNTILGLAQVVSGIDRIIDAYNFVKNGFSAEGLVPSNLSDPVFDTATAFLQAGKNGKVADEVFNTVKDTLGSVAGAAGKAADESDKMGRAVNSAGHTDFSQTVNGLQQSTTWAGRMADELTRAGIAARSLGGAGNVVQLGPPSAIGGYGAFDTGGKPVNSYTGGITTGSGYASGGYTGPGGKYTPKGVVHGGEFVMDKEHTNKHRALLEAIHNSPISSLPGYASGGRVPDDTGYHIQRASGRIDYFSQFGQLLRSEAPSGGGGSTSGSGYGGLDAWINAPHIGGTVSFLQLPTWDKIEDTQGKAWQSGIDDWWRDTSKTILNSRNRDAIGNFVREWRTDVTKFSTDPNYKFADLLPDVGRIGWAVPVLGSSDVWGDTVGKFVNYAGPSGGGSVNYGGDPREPVNYHIAASAGLTGPGSHNAEHGLRRVYAGTMASGGSFIVPGMGGTDSKRVEMMATPGEVINVTPKGQQSQGDVNVTMNINVKDAQSFQRSKNQIVGDLYRGLKSYGARNVV